MRKRNHNIRTNPTTDNTEKHIGKLFWDWIGKNSKQLDIFLSFLLFSGAAVGYYYVYMQLRELKTQNESLTKQAQDISKQTDELSIQNRLMEKSFIEENRPIAVVRVIDNVTDYLKGYPAGNGDYRNYTFKSTKLIISNKGQGILRFIGAFTYLDIEQGDNNTFRDDLICNIVDTTKVAFDAEFSPARGRIIIQGDSTNVTVRWRGISYKNMLWLQQYIVVLYEDINNNLYDTIHLRSIRFTEHLEPVTNPKVQVNSYESEDYHRYTNDEKQEIQKYYELTRHPLFSYIE